MSMKKIYYFLVFLLTINGKLSGQTTTKYVMSNKGCKIYCQSCNPGETITWDGGCINGLGSGSGSRIIYNPENKIVSNYSGKLIAGKRSGFGTNTWSNGNRYDGNWLNDIMHGSGKMFYSNGNIYDGLWANGEWKGRGTYKLKDGSKYVGIYEVTENTHFKGNFFNNKGVKVKEGVWDKQGNFIEGSYYLDNGKLFSVFKNGKEQLSEYGKKISPIYPKELKIWEKPRHFYGGSPVTYFEEKRKYGIINREGEVFAYNVYSSIWDFSDGLMTVYKESGGVRKGGYIDQTGKEIIPLKYDQVNDFVDGLAKVCYEISRNGSGGANCGYIDKNDRIIIPFRYSFDRDGHFFYGKGIAAEYDGKKTNIIDMKGNVLKTGHGKLTIASPGNRFIRSMIDPRDDIRELLDENLNVLYRTTGNDIRAGGYGTFLVGNDVVDEFGKRINKDSYEDLSWFVSDLARFKINGNYGFIDRKGNEIISPKYNSLGNFYDGLARASVNGELFGFISKTEVFIVPAIYSDAQDFDSGLAPVKKGDKWGFIDTKGEVVIPFLYDEVTEFRKNIAWVYDSTNGWGILHKPN